MSPTYMTPQEYALARGWDHGQIEDTARLGVSDEDAEALGACGLTPDELLSWCRERVAAAREARP